MARREAERAVARVEDGRTVLRVGGVIQSVTIDDHYSADVWDALLPRRKPDSALILGLGGASLAHLMTRRWGPFPITGVERDPEVIRLAWAEFGLDRLSHLHIVAADAFAWVRLPHPPFGAICVDMYVAGKLAHGALSPAFLRDVRRLVGPSGEVCFNLWRSAYLEDQTRRIKGLFHIEDTVEVDGNVAVHVTPR